MPGVTLSDVRERRKGLVTLFTEDVEVGLACGADPSRLSGSAGSILEPYYIMNQEG